MKKALGSIEIMISVICPHCSDFLDLTYGLNQDIEFLKNNTLPNPNINQEIECTSCDQIFLLNGLEYD